jgi:3-hydroxy-3-methylglutaryl CoA synthase
MKFILKTLKRFIHSFIVVYRLSTARLSESLKRFKETAKDQPKPKSSNKGTKTVIKKVKERFRRNQKIGFEEGTNSCKSSKM